MIRDVKEIEESTLWEDTGRQIQNKSKGNQEDTRKTVVFVIGERLSGTLSVHGRQKFVHQDSQKRFRPRYQTKFPHLVSVLEHRQGKKTYCAFLRGR
jgi:hypothetical protein